MQRLGVHLGVLAAVCGVAALTLAGSPALASSRPAGGHRAGRSVTGLELIAGSAHGKALTASIRIPLRLRGVVRARGFIRTGVTKYRAISTSAGRLVIRNTGRRYRQSLNNRTCRYRQTEKATFRVAGRKSTGAFAGASGPMKLRIYFTVHLPRHKSGKHKGQCDASGNAPIQRYALIWRARIVLTVR
jgi:hypothetical protein